MGASSAASCPCAASLRWLCLLLDAAGWLLSGAGPRPGPGKQTPKEPQPRPNKADTAEANNTTPETVNNPKTIFRNATSLIPI